MDIVRAAFRLEARVEAFVARVRRFFYRVALAGRRCPRCGGPLEMLREGRCRCTACRHAFDPTVAFQRCPSCDGRLRLRVRRYRCRSCGADVASRFLFDGLVFDAAYFRQKMAEHRQCQQQRREQACQHGAESRSASVSPGAAELEQVPGLVEALDALTGDVEPLRAWAEKAEIDLERYQRHVRAHTGPEPVAFDEIPALDDDRRRDRVGRFIAVIFLAHAGILDAWQDGRDIVVIQREAHGKRQAIPGDAEAAA